MSIPQSDRETLRSLATRVAEIAALPVHKTKIDMWKRLNRLESVRPMVWITQICWNEVIPASSLGCTDKWAQGQEMDLRRLIYQWDNLPADMVVEPVLYSEPTMWPWFGPPIVDMDTFPGLKPQIEPPKDSKGWGDGAMHFTPVIREEADVEKIAMPKVKYDAPAHQLDFERMSETYAGIIEVRKRGITGFWNAPVDDAILLYGITELYTDMMDRPALVHKTMQRISDQMDSRIEQCQALGLLALNNGNVNVGSGGLGYSDELPQRDFDGKSVRTMDMWGTGAAQIFAQVSPDMHEEFSLQYELKILNKFGLNCYGCCEPYHRKIDMLKKIPRLRRISMSPYVNVDEGAAAIGDKYIYSNKPNPALLAGESWDPDFARKTLREILTKTKGCHVEVIMKDITTLRNDPRRLSEWAKLAVEVAEEFPT